MANRKITIELDENVSKDDYAKLANVIWAVASVEDHFVQVSFDSGTTAGYLNKWYAKNVTPAVWK
ncbi:hypothetical protein [Actinoplanes sp. M2I2]|uniref:hypothetical protein n=1 Tax=Actinoplanes sp. M2I2 TaxID=1734444 RepID=UPI0020210688|nr:hypothetical protein [Actinoplanes sp. M2I2]